VIKKIKATGIGAKRRERPKAVKHAQLLPGPLPGVIRQLPDGAINRIIETTGEKPDNEGWLAHEICQASGHFADDLWDQSPKLRKDVGETLKKVRDLLAGNPGVALLGTQLPEQVAQIRNWLDEDRQLGPGERIARALGKKSILKSLTCVTYAVPETVTRRLAARRRPRNPAPLELLAVSLVGVYARHFNASPTFDRHDGKPRGAVIRFVKATMTELGVGHYKPESIARAVVEWRGWANPH